MSAAADYPALASFACSRGVTRDSPELQASWALAEIDRLRAITAVVGSCACEFVGTVVRHIRRNPKCPLHGDRAIAEAPSGGTSHR